MNQLANRTDDNLTVRRTLPRHPGRKRVRVCGDRSIHHTLIFSTLTIWEEFERHGKKIVASVSWAGLESLSSSLMAPLVHTIRKWSCWGNEHHGSGRLGT